MKTFHNATYRHMARFRHVTVHDWNDWQWQWRNRITDPDDLAAWLDLNPELLRACAACFPVAVTPYFASLITHGDPHDPIYRQVVPDPAELAPDPANEAPLWQAGDCPIPGLIHRYADRVLLQVSLQCLTYCRHCTRRDQIKRAPQTGAVHLAAALDYIRAHPSIVDVLISGGDPLVYDDQRLENIVRQVRAINHVQIVRIGTRAPVVLPQRITTELAGMLSRYHPLYINTQFNHPREITEQAHQACRLLSDAGIPLGNQTVLLRGVNDCPRVMKQLMRDLLCIRVKPYYIHQCDPAPGTWHFRTTITRGMEIMEQLRGHITGLGVPTYAVDTPGGGGKAPLQPQYLLLQSEQKAWIRTHQGKIAAYHLPGSSD